jgi:hypothetical protein
LLTLDQSHTLRAAQVASSFFLNILFAPDAWFGNSRRHRLDPLNVVDGRPHF